MRIAKLKDNDFDNASKLLWQTFYAFEKNNTDIYGMEKFRDLTSPISLKMNSFDGYIQIFGAYDRNDLKGVIGIKEKNHIAFLYVDKNEIGKGIGSKLLNFALKKCEEIVTVNSSDYALPFYKKFGFREIGERTKKDGVVFTPMKKNK